MYGHTHLERCQKLSKKFIGYLLVNFTEILILALPDLSIWTILIGHFRRFRTFNTNIPWRVTDGHTRPLFMTLRTYLFIEEFLQKKTTN